MAKEKQHRLTPSRSVRMERSLRALIALTAMAVSGGVMGTTLTYLAHQWAPMTAFLGFTLGMGFGLARMLSARVRIEAEPLNALDRREAWRIGRECLVRGLTRGEAFSHLEAMFPHAAQISRYFDAGLTW